MIIHDGTVAAAAGAPLEEAALAVVMVHGRGDSAGGILQLAGHLDLPHERVAFVAPQAQGGTWYPRSFLAPFEENEPWLTSALTAVGAVATTVAEAGVASERTVLLGFSQGACLVSEYAARQGGAFGGVIALSGGLIGPEGTEFRHEASLRGTTAFFGCSDVDPHIPVGRVHESADAYERQGARVEKRIYPGMPHTVNQDELEFISRLLRDLSA